MAKSRSSANFELSALNSRCTRVLQSSKPKIPSYVFRGAEQSAVSKVTQSPFDGGSIKKNVYSGTAVVGIATTHKSNLVPVFNYDHVKEISTMRR